MISKNFILSFIVFGTFFIIWDVLATQNGEWYFNRKYVTGVYLLNLPIEEILFFFCIPFASILIYEWISLRFKEKKFITNRSVGILLLTILLFSYLYKSHSYTSTVLLFTGIFIFIESFTKDSIFRLKNYYFFITLSFIPFLLVNSLLTFLPIVEYSNIAIIGFRIGTIPIEDFLYSFLLLSICLKFYLFFKERTLKTLNI